MGISGAGLRSPWLDACCQITGTCSLYVDTYPDARLREIAAAIGITDRATHTIIRELEEAGYLSRERVGRRNRYTVHHDAPLRHARVVGRTLGDLLRGLEPQGYRAARALDPFA